MWPESQKQNQEKNNTCIWNRRSLFLVAGMSSEIVSLQKVGGRWAGERHVP